MFFRGMEMNSPMITTENRPLGYPCIFHSMEGTFTMDVGWISVRLDWITIAMYIRRRYWWRPWEVTDFIKESFTIVRGFHRTFATGAAFPQRTLTHPDTWACPLWDVHVFQCWDQYLLNLSCFRTFEFRTFFGTSILHSTDCVFCSFIAMWQTSEHWSA